MKIFFDLGAEEKYHRIEWEKMLDEASANNSADCSLVFEKSSCDVVILSREPPISSLKKISPLHHEDISKFVWDHSDQPVGRMSGFYCSLPRPTFDGRRHQTFCYPITYNELIQPFPLADARYDYGFMGGITAPLRKRIIRHLSADTSLEGFIKIQGGPWDRMFDRTGVAAKVEYSDHIRLSKFILCPRGNGVGSVRLFEVMKAGRVPVIISDNYVLPSGIDWKTCSVIVRENDIGSIAKIIRATMPYWETLSTNARRCWEGCFSAEALTGQLRRMMDNLSDAGALTSARQITYISSHLQAASGQALRRITRVLR